MQTRHAETLAPGITRWTVDGAAASPMSSISYLIPSIGRETLALSLASVDLQPGDEILVNQHDVPAKTWGLTERKELLPFARGAWLMFVDDDDAYAPGYRDSVMDAMQTLPNLQGRRYLHVGTAPRPIVFRMRYTDGKVLWAEPEMRMGNIGTPMMAIPNVPNMLGVFNETRYVGDFDFINTLRWPRACFYWRPEIILQVGGIIRGHSGQRGRDYIRGRASS